MILNSDQMMKNLFRLEMEWEYLMIEIILIMLHCLNNFGKALNKVLIDTLISPKMVIILLQPKKIPSLKLLILNFTELIPRPTEIKY